MSLIQIGSKIIYVNPTISTLIYASGRLLGPKSILLDSAVHGGGSLCALESITVIDSSNQGGVLDLLFWQRQPDANISSVDNTAFAVTTAEVQASFLGMVSVAATDYKVIGTSQVASLKSIGMAMRSDPSRPDLQSASKSGIYVTMISRDTKTYGATGLGLRIGLIQY